MFLDKIGSKTKICIFVNERVLDDCCKAAFQFLVRNNGVKIKGLDTSDNVDFFRFKMF